MPASNNALRVFTYMYNNYPKCVIISRHSLGISYNYPKCVGCVVVLTKCVGFVDSLWVVLQSAQGVVR